MLWRVVSTQGVCPHNIRVTSSLALAAESVRLVSTTAPVDNSGLAGQAELGT